MPISTKKDHQDQTKNWESYEGSQISQILGYIYIYFMTKILPNF